MRISHSEVTLGSLFDGVGGIAEVLNNGTGY